MTSAARPKTPPPTSPARRGEAAARIAPFALFVGLLILAAAWPSLAAAIPPLAAFEPWLYALRTAAALALLVALWPCYVELRAPRGLGRVAWIESAAVGLLVTVAWVFLGPVLRIGTGAAEATPPWPAGGVTAAIWIGWRMIGTALVVPLLEELFWRSYLMRRIDAHDFLRLDPSRASLFAVGLSSAVFALEHRELLAGFLAGLAFAWLYRRHRSLWPAVLAHAVANLALGAYVLASGDYGFW